MLLATLEALCFFSSVDHDLGCSQHHEGDDEQHEAQGEQ
jgi:hypothetical protein